MAGYQKALDRDDLFLDPSKGDANSLKSTPEQDSSKPKRSLTPRGPLFLDYNEAHRKICKPQHTNPFRKASVETQYGNEIPLTNTSSSTSSNDREKMGKKIPEQPATDSGQLRLATVHPGWSSPSSSRLPDSAVLDDPSESTDVLTCRTPEKLRNVSLESQYPNTSQSTVGNILDQYARDSGAHSRSLDESSLAYTSSDIEPTRPSELLVRGGVTTRTELRDEDGMQTLNRYMDKVICDSDSAVQSPDKKKVAKLRHGCLRDRDNLSKPPKKSLPYEMVVGSLKDSHVESQETTSLPQVSNALSSKDLLSANNEQGAPQSSGPSLIPRPLRVPSNRDQSSCNHPSQELHLDSESSVSWGISTESTDDPFKYDSERYRQILQSSREREISQNLERMSNFEPLAEAEMVAAGEVAASGAAEQTSDSNILWILGKPACGFFDPSVSPERCSFGQHELPGAQVDRSQCEAVKVVINHKPEAGCFGTGHDPGNKRAIGLTVNKNKDGVIDFQLPKDSTSDYDWVTEATSEAGFGAIVVSDPGVEHDIKPTGSSIADLSDDGYSICRHDTFGSQDHILQHPPGISLRSPYEVQSLKGTQQRVLLPRSQVNRFSGFTQNSMRLKSDFPKLGIPPLSRKILESNPFRRKSYQRAGSNSHFTYKDREPSKYDYRDSMSSYAPGLNSTGSVHQSLEPLPIAESAGSFNSTKLLNEHAHTPESKHLDKANTQLNNAMEQAFAMGNAGIREPAEDNVPTPLGGSFDEPGSAASTGKFSFPLIDLTRAQALHKLRRESGETDETETGVTRYKRVYSNVSTRANETITPPLPRLPAVFRRSKEPQRQCRSPVSSSYTPPNWQKLKPGDMTGESQELQDL
jgi:hypothetical protein